MCFSFLLVACPGPVRPLEIELRSHVDGDIDHLAIDGNGRHATLQPLGKDLSHLHIVGRFFRTGTETLVTRLDPRGMRTDGSLEAGVPGTPDGFSQLFITGLLLRQAQRVTHSRRLPADRDGNRDQLGLDVLERLEVQERLGRHPEISGQLVLVYREDAETRACASDFQRMPDAGGGIDLDVYFEYSRADPPACFKRIQALAGSSDVLRAAHSLHYDAS